MRHSSISQTAGADTAASPLRQVQTKSWRDAAVGTGSWQACAPQGDVVHSSRGHDATGLPVALMCGAASQKQMWLFTEFAAVSISWQVWPAPQECVLQSSFMQASGGPAVSFTPFSQEHMKSSHIPTSGVGSMQSSCPHGCASHSLGHMAGEPREVILATLLQLQTKSFLLWMDVSGSWQVCPAPHGAAVHSSSVHCAGRPTLEMLAFRQVHMKSFRLHKSLSRQICVPQGVPLHSSYACGAAAHP